MDGSFLTNRRAVQRDEALRLANKVRATQAELKKRLRDGRVDPVKLLNGRDEMWSRFAFDIKVGVLLMSIPTFGRGTVNAILVECGLFHEDKLSAQPDETRQRVAYLVSVTLGRDA